MEIMPFIFWCGNVFSSLEEQVFLPLSLVTKALKKELLDPPRHETVWALEPTCMGPRIEL
jgi:hypothetical protein